MKPTRATAHLLLAGWLTCAITFAAIGAEVVESNAPPAAVQTENTEALQEMERAVLLLQEQIHATQLAVDHNQQLAEAAAARNASNLAERLQAIQHSLAQQRAHDQEAAQQAEAAAARNATNLAGQLHAIEDSLSQQRTRDFEAMQSANHTVLIVACSFAGAAFLAMLFTAWLQWRTVSRFAEQTAALTSSRALGPGWTVPALGGIDPHLTMEPPGSPNARLLDALGKLEKRIFALEHTTTVPLNEQTGNHPESRSPSNDAAEPADAEPQTSEAARITLLLGKGQSLLNLDQADEAIGCFDEVLALDRNNTDALVKKGVALERQRKLTEAIACYDQAIATDDSITIAYLYKGGIYNRMERFNEALECYEQALRSQEKRRAS